MNEIEISKPVPDRLAAVAIIIHVRKNMFQHGIILVTRFSVVSFLKEISLIARFMGPTWVSSAADRTQVGPMLVP